jgi:hypothetical protein
MLGDRDSYMLIFNGVATGFKSSIKQALLSNPYDVITIQQSSILSGDKDTYYPYVAALTEYIRKFAPRATLCVHQTWAYEDGSERIKLTPYQTHKEMIASVKKVYGEIASEIGADALIPSGEMFSALLDAGIEKVHRDGFHASLGTGRYALALLWYRCLTGKDVTNNTFNDFDVPVSAEEIEIVKRCVSSLDLEWKKDAKA